MYITQDLYFNCNFFQLNQSENIYAAPCFADLKAGIQKRVHI